MKELLQDKVVVFILIASMLFFTGLFWAGVHFSKRVDSCEEKNGIMIKAASGYVCIKKDVIL